MCWSTYNNDSKKERFFMKSIDITIQDKEGLHARPAGILSKAAKGFESKVTMTKNAKSPT